MKIRIITSNESFNKYSDGTFIINLFIVDQFMLKTIHYTYDLHAILYYET